MKTMEHRGGNNGLINQFLTLCTLCSHDVLECQKMGFVFLFGNLEEYTLDLSLRLLFHAIKYIIDISNR